MMALPQRTTLRKRDMPETRETREGISANSTRSHYGYEKRVELGRPSATRFRI